MVIVSILKHRREGTDSPPGSCLSFSFSNMARSFRSAPLLQSSDVPGWSFSHTDFVLFFFFFFFLISSVNLLLSVRVPALLIFICISKYLKIDQ